MRIFWTCFENMFFWTISISLLVFYCNTPVLTIWYHLSALETAFQTTHRPQYNWPWINSLLTKFHIGKQRFGPLSTKPFLDRSRKFCRRYQKRTPTEQMCLLGRRLHTSEAIYYMTRLGSDTIEKFHVSKLLSKVHANGCHLLVFAFAAFSSSGGTFSYQKSIPTLVDSLV